ncbi:DUF3558 domain-containing protein [Actinoalloteichus caeruleus]|uniref:DUF3558 domain-containing protein n=1 Tax=Actinoalloteichus cyanogriseus TaxID=2893586 RepID=UPI001FE170BF|nr:DUF3558 domain-containing protein [Actinoalloteichus caeruleus]
MIGWTPRHRCAVATAGVALLAVVTGCTSETPGQALSVPTPVPGSSDTAGRAVEDGPSSEEELASVLPCEVLDAEQVADLGFDPSTADFEDVGVIYACSYTVAPLETPLLSINIRVDRALDELNLTDYNLTEYQVGPLRALLITDDREPNKCQISMELGESAHATVVVSFTESREEACESAERVAGVLEPELPREAR